MASIKIPYRYTHYENAPLATWADKTIHKPGGLIMFISFFFCWSVFFLTCGVGSLFDVFSDNVPTAVKLIILVLGVFWLFVAPIIFPFAVKKIWDSKRLGYKLAAFDVARKTDPSLNRKLTKGVILLVAIVLAPLILGVIVLSF